MNIDDILTSTIYSNGVATLAIIISLIAVPASGYLSYFFAIRGEKRKEWNLLADPMRQKLLMQIDAILRSDYYLAEISRKDILMFSDVKKDNGKLIEAFNEFEKSHSFKELWIVEAGGRTKIGDTTNALRSSQRLLSMIERK